jgi:hypothetical protein
MEGLELTKQHLANYAAIVAGGLLFAFMINGRVGPFIDSLSRLFNGYASRIELENEIYQDIAEHFVRTGSVDERLERWEMRIEAVHKKVEAYKKNKEQQAKS